MQRIRTSLVAALAFAIVALVAFARPPAPAAPAPVYATIDLAHGPTLLKAPGTLHLNLAANYFGPGSPAFNGDVACTGTVLKTAGAFELGTTTMVLERLNDASIDYPMTTGPVPIYARVVEFGLTGSSPIQFTVSGQAQSWNVTAVMGETRVDSVEHDLSRTADTSGTYSGSVKIPLIVKFTRGAVVKTLDLGIVELTGSSVTWTTVTASNTAGLAVPQLNLGVALTGTFTSSDLDLNVVPPAVNPNRPGASYIDGTATVSGSVATIGRQCTIGAGAVIDAGVVIGPHASIGANVHVYSNAVIGDYATIDSGASIGTGAWVDSHCSIGTNVVIGADTNVDPLASVGNSTTIGDNSLVRSGASISSGCTIGDDVIIGNDATIGSGSSVADDLHLFMGAVVPSSTNLTKDIHCANYSDGTVALEQWPPGMAPTMVATASMGDVGKKDSTPANGKGDNRKAGVQPTPQNPTSDPKYGDLKDLIGTDIAPGDRNPGCTGPDYKKNVNDCNTYASRLRKRLEDHGYPHTTFTVVSKEDPSHRWCCDPTV